MRPSAALASSSPESAEPDSLVFSSRSVDSVACSAASSSAVDLALPFSSESRLVSSLICSVSRFSAVSLPLASWLAKYCASMKIDMRKVTTSSSVDSTST